MNFNIDTYPDTSLNKRYAYFNLGGNHLTQGLRDAIRCSDLGTEHTGWFTDDLYQEDTLEGYVVMLHGRAHSTKTYLAVHDSCSDSLRVDMQSDEEIDFSDVHSDYDYGNAVRDAMTERRFEADSVAEYDAETEREYQADERQRIEDERQAELTAFANELDLVS